MKKILPTLAITTCFAFQATAQNVGIGTNTPGYPLTVVAQGTKGIVQKDGVVEVGFYTSPTSAFLQTWSNHALNFTTGYAAAQMTLLPSGNFGIGTTAPSAKLDVNGTIRIRGGNPNAGDVLTATDANGNAQWLPPGGTKTLDISFASFLPANDNIGWLNSSNIGRYPANNITGIVNFEAPLLLPVGSKLISIDWFFIDNNAKTFEFCVYYDGNYETVNPGNGIVGVGCVFSTVNNALAQIATKSLNNHIMDNTPYFLRVSVTDWPNNGQMVIKGARVTYQ
jgi:hypothetical protein